MQPLKVVLLGDAGVGKSSLLTRYLRDCFEPYTENTVGAAFFSHTLLLNDDTTRSIPIQLWDTAGQERFQALASLYTRGAHVALLVYDISRQQSLQSLERWVKELEEGIMKVVIGNKVDLHEHRSVPQAEAQDIATNLGAALYRETSARDSINVHELFQAIGRLVVERGLCESGADPVDLSAVARPSRCCQG